MVEKDWLSQEYPWIKGKRGQIAFLGVIILTIIFVFFTRVGYVDVENCWVERTYLVTLSPPDNATHYKIRDESWYGQDITGKLKIGSRPLTWMWAERVPRGSSWTFSFSVIYYCEIQPGVLERCGGEYVSKTLYYVEESGG